jgi:Glycosyl transferases, related to UDP-glucuronosyltransferase
LAHGGLLGAIEAVHVGVPMVGIPMFGDQHTNMKMVEAAGMGIILRYEDITKDNVLKALRTVLDNSR